jgi:hypothetical protein
MISFQATTNQRFNFLKQIKFSSVPVEYFQQLCIRRDKE